MSSSKPPSQTRQLEDILQDPNADWSEIRQAMKAQGRAVCTNAALMRTIAAGRAAGVTAAVVNGGNEPSPTSSSAAGMVVPSTAVENDVSNDNNDDGTPVVVVVSNDLSRNGSVVTKQEEADENDAEWKGGAIETFQVPLNKSATNGVAHSQQHPSDGNADTTSDNAQLRRSSLPMSRRRSSRAAVRRASNASVDLMDFGVDHDCELDKSTKSVDSGMLSSLSNYSSHGSDGFMGWRRGSGDDDEEVDVGNTTKQVRRRSSHSSSNLSHLVDEAGFLDWTASIKSKDSSRVSSSLDAEIIVDLIMENGLNDDKGGGSSSGEKEDKSSGRIGQSELKESLTKQWKIEDYENPDDNLPAGRDNNFPMNPLNFFKRRSDGQQKGGINSNLDKQEPFWQRIYVPSSKSIPTQEMSNNMQRIDAVQMEDIKKALLNVSKSSLDEKGDDGSQPAIRRRSTVDGDTPASASHVKKVEAKAKPGFTRRQTIFGVPPFLGGGRGANSTSDGKSGPSDEDEEAIAKSSDSTLKAAKSKGVSRRKTLIGRALAASRGRDDDSIFLDDESIEAEREQQQQHSNSSSNNNNMNFYVTNSDNREAIWINRKDGDVDIEKECRKLYLEDESMKQQSQKGTNPFRPKVCGRI
eukprot:scaffold530_cov193-Alexandrium_tamarense.AAC.45